MNKFLAPLRYGKIYNIIAFSFLLISNLFAQTWQITNGPNEGVVGSLAINSSGYVFAGTTGGNGVYLSTNNGTSWTQNGLTNSKIESLAFNSSGYLFAGTVAGVYLSTNNGTSWTQNGLTSSNIESFAFNSSGYLFAGTDTGVYLSTNNGTSWTHVNNGLGNIDVLALTINSSGYIFAGTLGGGVYMSTNNGTSWTQVNTGLTNSFVSSLAVDSFGSVFAGTYGGAVHRSMNNGASWTQLSNGLPSTTMVHSIVINSSGYIFASAEAGPGYRGVYLSTDGGYSWTLSGLSNYTSVGPLAINSSGYVFAGTLEGVVCRTSSSTTINTIPSPPILAGPANGSTGISINPVLSWNASTGAVSYRLQVSTDSTFTAAIFDTSGINNTSNSISSLSYQTKYYWRINASNMGGTGAWSTIWNFTTIAAPTVVAPPNISSISVTGLSQNYPNPFNPSTTIKYQIAKDSYISLSVYDILGQKVKTLINGLQQSGYYNISWDGNNDIGRKVSSGIYIYRLQSGNFIKTLKMNLLK